MSQSKTPEPKRSMLIPTIILFTLQSVILISYIGAPLTGSRLLAGLGLIFLGYSWLVEWARWTVGRRNLAEMPVFGTGELGAQMTGDLPRVALVAPARNEEAGVEKAVRSMAALEYPGLDIFLVDDHSTDATPAILDRLARELPNIRVLHDPPPQPGWLGKQNAVWHAVQQVAPDVKWLLFTDGDIVFAPKLLRDAVAYAEAEQIDFLTCVPWLEIGSMTEALMLSSYLRFVDTHPLRAMNDPKSVSLGIGAFMLVRRQVYQACGGHAAIATEPFDDTYLTKLIKDSGVKMGIGRAADLLRCRQYLGWSDMIRKLTRKERVGVQDRIGGIICKMQFLLLDKLLMLPMAVAGIVAQVLRGELSLMLTAFSLLACANYVQGALTYSSGKSICALRPLWPWLYPWASLVGLWVNAIALVERIRGKPSNWRGRDLAAGASRQQIS